MRLVVFSISDWERPWFEALKVSKGWEIHLLEERLGPELDPPPEISDADAIAVFVHETINEETLAKFPRLKLVLTRSTGYDHIDLDACRQRGVAAYNVPDYGSTTVAEYTIGLMLALLRAFRPMIEQSVHGIFSRQRLRGFDLAGKRVGVVGTGRIGKEVIKRLTGFAVEVLAYDKYPDPKFAKAIPRMQYTDLETLYRSSNVLTFHVPLTAETQHIFNRDSLRLLQWKTFLVNTSRGPVVETEAIIDGLREGRLAGVALDTFESEEVMMEEQFYRSEQLSQAELRRALATYHLLRSDRVILSPHNAYNSEEALRRIFDSTVANIEAFLEKRPVPSRLV